MSDTTVIDSASDEIARAGAIGRYSLLRRLGQGGMAVVYLARHPTLKVDVALKTITPEHAQDAYFRRKFLEEGEKQAQLSHPHILTVHDSDEHSGALFLVTEYADGGSLRSRMDAQRIDLREALVIIRKLADALAYAHGRRNPVVHLDLKPENVLIAGGEPKLADFGIARILDDSELKQSVVALNVAYCAPEQLYGTPQPASDVYALGLMLWELVLGRTPTKLAVTGAPERQTIAASLPQAPPAVVDLIARCLDADPAGRPGAADVVQALDALLQPRTARAAWRWVAVAAAACLIAITLAATPARTWLIERYQRLFPPAEQVVTFEVAPRSASIWVDGHRLDGNQTSLAAPAPTIAVTADGHVGTLLSLELPRLPNTPVRASLAVRPDTVDFEYLAFRNAARTLDGESYLWRADWQDPALVQTVRVLDARRKGAAATEELAALQALSRARDAAATAALDLLRGLGVPVDDSELMERLEQAASAGDALSSVLLAESFRVAAESDDPGTAERMRARANRYLQRAASQGMPDTAATLTAASR